jgi:hypothetical protein
MAARLTKPGQTPDHGTLSRYRYHRCRCDDCRHANTIAKRVERTGDPTRGLRVAQHGTRTKYVKGCRCGLCKGANRTYQRDYMRGRG